MFVYWMMFLIPVLALASPMKTQPSLRKAGWWGLGVLFTLIMGLRHRVGADWFSYAYHYELTDNVPLREAILTSDIAYALLNWLCALIDGQIYLVNVICAIVVMHGLIFFARRQPVPWLVIVMAVPYYLIVVSMGYTRQGVAMAIEMMALYSLIDDRNVKKFAVQIVIAGLFHKSALVMLPIAMLVSTTNRGLTILWVVLFGGGVAGAMLVEYYEILWHTYIESDMESEGSGIRVAMNALPSIILLCYRQRLRLNEHEVRLWTWIAIFSLMCVPLVGLSSTAVDRVALYFMPIQFFVLSRIYLLFPARWQKLSLLGVAAMYGIVQWVWLVYSKYASMTWLPYQMFPFTD
ncbi:MAG: EpsG family protein [Rubrivivax sp.]|nr:MAG: EpsG family protein [Rubrivivax sp.]